MDILTLVLTALGSLTLGALVGFIALRSFRNAQAKLEAERIISQAKQEAQRIERDAQLQAKEDRLAHKQTFEEETQATRRELQTLENRLVQQQEKIEQRSEALDKRRNEQESKERSLESRGQELNRLKEDYDSLVRKAQADLEKVAHLTVDEAKESLIRSLEDDARLEAAKRVKFIEEEAKDNAEKRARYLVGTAIQRFAADHVQEKTVSVVSLPSDDMKGRIIGREGRNIRTLEQLTGVDLIIDDTPEAVVISGFSPLRRQLAKLVLEELISDGRIHPTRIEEVFHKVEKQFEGSLKELGEQAIFDLGISRMHPELLKLVGKLNYRTSYGQNQYKHAIEVAHIAGMLAAEMGEDIKIAKRGGLLHDIGKVVDHEVEGGHAVIGAELAKKHGEDEPVWHAIGAHHEDYPIESVMDIIVQAADAISGSRPGARREVLETYIKRLEDMESISNSFTGVEKSFAIQAGREVRVIVQNQKLNDEETVMLSRDIAKRIETELTYPGQVKVTVIRETRAVEFAR